MSSTHTFTSSQQAWYVCVRACEAKHRERLRGGIIGEIQLAEPPSPIKSRANTTQQANNSGEAQPTRSVNSTALDSPPLLLYATHEQVRGSRGHEICAISRNQGRLPGGSIGNTPRQASQPRDRRPQETGVCGVGGNFAVCLGVGKPDLPCLCELHTCRVPMIASQFVYAFHQPFKPTIFLQCLIMN